MYINPWFVASIILILILWYLAVPKVEMFENIFNDKFDSYVGPKIHTIIDNNCNIIDYGYQMPSGDGIYGCTQVPCPDKLDSNQYVCWNCCNYH